METATAADCFNFELLKKPAAAALARALGIRKDWERQTKPEIIAMLRGFSVGRLIEAAESCPEFFDSEDIENLTTPLEEGEAEEAAELMADEEAEDSPASATPDSQPLPQASAKPAGLPAYKPEAAPVPTPKAPDVTQVAALLAQLLATGKAGLDAEEVRDIVDPLLAKHGAAILETMDAKLKAIPAREIIVKSERAEVKMDGQQHENFETLLQLCAATQPDGHRLNVWLYGPPGTGKTTAARNVAKGLGMDFQCNGALGTKYELTGFIDAGGTYRSTPFRQAWEHGGVYLFDEIDGSVPAAVVAFNAALANGVMAFPDGMIERHPDCVIIAAANTTGQGATADFTGRMKMDAATLDRFVMLEWAIDEALERAMCPSASWVNTVQAFRAKVKAKGLKLMITPRATIYGAALLAQGLKPTQVRELVLRKGMTPEQWAMVND